jgi:hypothetical protein
MMPLLLKKFIWVATFVIVNLREREKNMSVNENCFEKKKMKNAIYYLRIDI